ncbi:hypothetical protein FB45DRAFT_872724 [Roridomyces roridus]|uniref:Uncharacterized protein n=1 Tax=Roridomyces roridus TaxID=1738132 RepID=A0AAD7BD13_9AGAR|nr:hypothetical protein FB45DRAFT_872724 [Roridomyces roridus]
MKFSAFALVPLAAVLANAQKFKFCNVGQQGCAYTNDVSDDTDRNVLLLTNDTTAPNQNWVKYSPSGENIIVHNANTDQFLTVYRAPKPVRTHLSAIDLFPETLPRCK